MLSPSTADAREVNSPVVNGISRPVDRLTTTSFVNRMPVEDGCGRGCRKDEP